MVIEQYAPLITPSIARTHHIERNRVPDIFFAPNTDLEAAIFLFQLTKPLPADDKVVSGW